MSKTTFWDVIERTLEKVGTPLSAKEIWEKANELGTIGDFTTTGKTPWATIAAYCYTAINGSDNSIIIQTNERPAQFFLRRLSKNINLVEVTEKKEEQKIKEEKKIEKKFHERDLHTILVAFANVSFR